MLGVSRGKTALAILLVTLMLTSFAAYMVPVPQSLAIEPRHKNYFPLVWIDTHMINVEQKASLFLKI